MDFDLLFRNALIIDGTGERSAFRGDLGVKGDCIAAIGDLAEAEAANEFDISGRILCPGFIDVHIHSEIAIMGGLDQFSSVRQGVTTHLLAPDGFGWAGLAKDPAVELWEYTRFSVGNVERIPIPLEIEEYLNLFEGHAPVNVYPQVPHCAIRLAVMGWSTRSARGDEILEMERLTRDWMEAGAGALNLGLDYQPTANASFQEMVALCRVAREYGGIYAAHIRYRLLGRYRAWMETVELAKAADIPVHISHERVDDEVEPVLELVEREDVDLTFESYLYAGGMTHPTMRLPMEYQVGSPAAVLFRLQDAHVRQRCLAFLKDDLKGMDPVIGHTRSGRFTGEKLSAVAVRRKQPLEVCLYDLILEEEGLQTYVMPWPVSAEAAAATLDRTVQHPRMMVASDAVYNVPFSHPRSHGCFPRVLGEFVRERNRISLESAVFKMTGFPAGRFGVPNRGEIAVGKAADLVVFDPDSVAGPSSWESPHLLPIGIEHVAVSGKIVIEDGKPTGALPGRLLRNEGKRR